MHGAGRVPQRNSGEKAGLERTLGSRGDTAGERNAGSSGRLLWKDVGKRTISSPGLFLRLQPRGRGFFGEGEDVQGPGKSAFVVCVSTETT